MPRTDRSSVDLQPDTSRLLPRPPRPVDLQGVDLSDNARTVLTKRYIRRDAAGRPGKNPGCVTLQIDRRAIRSPHGILL